MHILLHNLLLNYRKGVLNMSVMEALQLIVDELEKSSSCGLLGEKLRKARATLYYYVMEKLREDKENGKNN